MDDKLAWRVAIHEAGHSIAARVLRLSNCGGASVATDHAYADFPYNRGAMAGACAEALILGDCDDGALLWAYTAELLAPYQGLIVRLAAELWRAGSLDGGEIDEVVFGLGCQGMCTWVGVTPRSNASRRRRARI